MRHAPLLDAGGRELRPRVWVAETAQEARRGLLGPAWLGPGEGLWLPRCRAVHTFFMRFAIDAFFVDAGGRVIRQALGLRPWRLAWAARARHTLEFPAGGAPGLEAGMRLDLPF